MDPLAPPADFVAFAAWYVAERRRTDKPNTVKFYHEAAHDLAAWRAGVPLPFAALDDAALAALREWLHAGSRLCAATARDRLVKLGTVARRAEKLGLLAPAANPFARLALPRVGNKRPPRRPTEAERQAVLAVDLAAVPLPAPLLDRYPDYRRALALRRDIWTAQYLIRGTRCGDVLQLRERDLRPDRLSFAETKTGKLKNVARGPALDAILARYPPTGEPLAFVFPALDHRAPYAAEHPTLAQRAQLSDALRERVQWVNRGLVALARLAGVPPFTSHSARHLYTERAYAKTKDLRLVQTMLNHSDIATTEKYLKTLGYDALDAATELVLGE
ncbi:MAG: hypothetical protein NVS3B25_18870 [Hymenobacter sp.]